MNRRGFLSGILAAAAAPAIVRADSLMRIVPRDTAILTTAAGPHWEAAQVIDLTVMHLPRGSVMVFSLPNGSHLRRHCDMDGKISERVFVGVHPHELYYA